MITNDPLNYVELDISCKNVKDRMHNIFLVSSNLIHRRDTIDLDISAVKTSSTPALRIKVNQFFMILHPILDPY